MVTVQTPRLEASERGATKPSPVAGPTRFNLVWFPQIKESSKLALRGQVALCKTLPSYGAGSNASATLFGPAPGSIRRASLDPNFKQGSSTV